MKKFQFKPAFTRSDFIIFLRKYKNLMLFRGKSSLSYRFFEKILIEFKNKYKVAPHIYIYKAIYNLVPLFGFLKRKIGFKIKSYPALINSNKRKMLLLKWLVRDFKNKIFFKTRGYDVNYLANIFVQAASDQGRASITANNYKEAILKEKFNLKKSYGKKNPLLKYARNLENAKRFQLKKNKKEKSKLIIKNEIKGNKKTYLYLKRLEFLLPKTYSNRKYFRNLLKFRKFRRNPSLITDLNKRYFLFFFNYLKKIRGKGKKLEYLKWFSKRYNLHLNYDMNKFNDINIKKQLKTLYYPKTLKGKMDDSKSYNVFKNNKEYKLKKKFKNFKLYRYYAKKRTNN